MKALVVWSSADGTTQSMLIEGPYIMNQVWDCGRALVTVWDRQGGRKLRAVQFARVALIDVDRDDYLRRSEE